LETRLDPEQYKYTYGKTVRKALDGGNVNAMSKDTASLAGKKFPLSTFSMKNTEKQDRRVELCSHTFIKDRNFHVKTVWYESDK